MLPCLEKYIGYLKVKLYFLELTPIENKSYENLTDYAVFGYIGENKKKKIRKTLFLTFSIFSI